MPPLRQATRAIAPAVGVALLLVIVALLATVGGYVAFGLVEDTDPPPTARFEIEPGEDGVSYQLAHVTGATIDGDRLVVRGAADSAAFAGETVAVGTDTRVYPIAEELVIVWTSDDGTGYVLARFTADRTVPAPDADCSWIEAETDAENTTVKIDGIVVRCDVDVDRDIELSNGGAILGVADSTDKGLDADDAAVYGDVDVEEVVNMQNGTIAGDTRSRSADVKLDDAAVDGDVRAKKVVAVTGHSQVDGDITSDTKPVKVISATVNGSITSTDSVKLEDAVVRGNVYVDELAFDCTNSTIDGQSCGEYTPLEPSG